MSAEERCVANMDAREISNCCLPHSEGEAMIEEERKTKQQKVGVQDKCEEEAPHNLPHAEEQEPPEDWWFCPHCSELPCQFLQWQEELERIVDITNPDLTNKEKRYQLYCHVSCPRNGPMGKGNCRPLLSCSQQGMRYLYPSKKYTGYKSADNQQWTR
jgi:hypothetical protein